MDRRGAARSKIKIIQILWKINNEEVDMEFGDVKREILRRGWFYFGEKEFECTDLTDENIEYYMKYRKLPLVCDNCYKPLIFWEGSFYEKNVKNFLNMINAFESEVRGKFNSNVVVFYFDDKREMLNFLELLKQKTKEFDVKGEIQWRRACKEYQDLLPNLWRNAKEFIPDLR